MLTASGVSGFSGWQWFQDGTDDSVSRMGQAEDVILDTAKQLLVIRFSWAAERQPGEETWVVCTQTEAQFELGENADVTFQATGLYMFSSGVKEDPPITLVGPFHPWHVRMEDVRKITMG